MSSDGQTSIFGRGGSAVERRGGRTSAGRQSGHFAARLALWGPLTLSVGLGALAGVGGYTFRYAEGLSYFSTDPAACVNCHIMQPQYDAWQKASHHAVAVCVDCHLPHDFVPKYLAKAENGWRHGQKFTTQNFEEPIFVQSAGMNILQDNCLRCHGPLIDTERQPRSGMSPHPAHAGEQLSEEMQCVHCHWSVGHGQRAGMGGPRRAEEFEGLPASSAIHADVQEQR